MQNMGTDTGSMSSSAMTDPDKATANVERLSQSAHDMVDRMAESASSAAQRISEKGQRLAETSDHWAEMTRDCVRRHPFASVGVAVGAGMLLSLMTRRSGRSRRDTM